MKSNETPHNSSVIRPARLLDPGMCLTLRPMAYPQFYEAYTTALKNHWKVEEISFATDVMDLRNKFNEAERHLIHRLVAFFATGDTIVANNLVLNLYRHLNAPEARMFLSRQLFEEALHIQFYLTLLDTYIPDHKERYEAFAAIENIPSIQRKAEFCFKWIDSINELHTLETHVQRRRLLLNLICFAACIEGLFFFAAFSYVYYMRSRGLLHGLADGTNYVFKEETTHMSFAFEAIKVIRSEEPSLFDKELEAQVVEMMRDAIECEYQFAADMLQGGVMGLSLKDMRTYLEFCADQRFTQLGMPKMYNVRNPFPFMDLQGMEELANFFERRVSAYQVGAKGDVKFDEDF